MFEKIVMVTRKTRLAELIERFNSRGQAKFYIEHSGGDFGDYDREDSAYRGSLDLLRRGLDRGLKVQVIDRSFVPSFLFCPKDLVVALGQDGLVANVAKYVGDQPLVGVNPEPSRFDGVLLPYSPGSAPAAISRILEGHGSFRSVSLARVTLNDGQELRAFNDVFIGARTHVSARYRLFHGDTVEPQSSSGVIVSTGAGSSGWLSSVFNMASGLASFRGGNPVAPLTLPWESSELVFVVREPFRSKHSSCKLVAGILEAGEELRVESMMPTGGVIFSDGIEADFLEFNSGFTARISRDPVPCRLASPVSKAGHGPPLARAAA